MDEEVTDTTELSCPICLVTSNDNTNESLQDNDVKFLKTTCEHVFCNICIERVLLKPRHDSIPTLAPCPMCRDPVLLFDLRHASCVDESSSSVYAGISDVTSWSSEYDKYDVSISISNMDVCSISLAAFIIPILIVGILINTYFFNRQMNDTCI